MPIVKSITLSNQIRVSVWKIEESLTFFNNTALNLADQIKFQQLKSNTHQKGFLASRALLTHHQILPDQLYFLESGKPMLKGGLHLSLSHSFDYACIISAPFPVGIDVEKERPKILKVAPRFCAPDLYNNNCSDLTKTWCAKEALYKCLGLKGLSLKNDINVNYPFESTKQTSASIHHNKTKHQFKVYFEEFENYHLSFAVLIN